MDSHFLEFWGNYLLAVAKGQKQLDDATRWVRQGLKGFEELTALFKKHYGLEDLEPENPESAAAWEKAAVDFRKSFSDYFRVMGWVSKEEYQALEEENRILRQKISERDQTIKNLLSQSGMEMGQTLQVFQDLIQKQGEEFQNLIKKLSAPKD